MGRTEGAGGWRQVERLSLGQPVLGEVQSLEPVAVMIRARRWA